MLRDEDPRDPLSEDEWPDEQDVPDSDSVAVVSCPECGELVAEDTQQCPHCRMWIVASSAARRRSRTLFWPLLVGALIVALLMVWHGVRW